MKISNLHQGILIFYISVYIYVCVYNMEIYISNSMLYNINDKLETFLVKDVYLLWNMFR